MESKSMKVPLSLLAGGMGFEFSKAGSILEEKAIRVSVSS
jgi:hypothetical protein